MTRINVVPVQSLHQKHLVAEYRELPRVFKLARTCDDAPHNYVLGKGHVKFFYDKLEYLYKRQVDLYNEMIRRGYNPTFHPAPLNRYMIDKPELWNNWKPTEEDKRLNQSRIDERLKSM